MADVSDPKINEGTLVNPNMREYSSHETTLAYEDVRSNKSDVNWVLIDYEVRLYFFRVLRFLLTDFLVPRTTDLINWASLLQALAAWLSFRRN
jgi:hypothetical protein